MSATLRQLMSDIPSAGSRCKGTTKFADMQFLSKKVLGVLKVLRVI